MTGSRGGAITLAAVGLGLIALLALGLGCGGGAGGTEPVLSLTTTTLTFGAATTSQTFGISNTGQGTLTWTVTPNQTWVTCTPTSGADAGTVTVAVDRTGLAEGTTSGTITVSSNGGTQTVNVTVQVGAATAVLDGDATAADAAFFEAAEAVTDTANAPEVEYPGAGVVFPPNVAAPQIRFAAQPEGSAQTNARFQIVLSQGGTALVECVTTNTTWQMSEAAWATVTDTIAGGASARARRTITLAVYGAAAAGSSPTTKLLGEPVEFEISDETVSGLVYFWRVGGTDNDGDVMRMDADASTAPVAFYGSTTGEGCAGCHAISPNGSLVSVSDTAINTVVSASDKTVTDTFAGYFVAWSPDGGRAAYSKDGDIYIRDLTVSPVTETALSGAANASVTETMPTWSPDGTTIAFMRYTGMADISFGYMATISGSEICTIPSTGGTATVIVPGQTGVGAYYPAWSPSGEFIAYNTSTTESVYLPMGSPTSYSARDATLNLYTVSAGTSRVLTNANGTVANSSNSWPTWSPDSHWLAFASVRNDAALTDYDLFVTEITPGTGADSAAYEIPGANTANMGEHIPQWASS